MEIVTCHCLKCEAELGRFRNSWNGIGNTYFSPVHCPLSVDGFESTGVVYEAAHGSQIEDSLLQDLACAQCQHVLGLRCDSAPEGHLLHQSQMILRLAEMSVMSEGSRTKAKISIMKTFPLTHSNSGAKALPGSRRASASTSQPSDRLKPPRLLPSISQTPFSTSRMSTPMHTPPQTEVAKFKTRAEDAIKSQQQDIDRLSEAVDRIERDMRIFKDFMEEVRAELAFNRQLQSQGSEGITSVRNEFDELRQQVQWNQSRPVSKKEPSHRSLQVIAQDVQMFSQKVGGVDVLRSELEQLRARLNSLEALASNSAEDITQSSPGMRIGATETHSSRKRNHNQNHRDEAISHGDQAISLELPTKKRKIRNMPANMEASVVEANNSNRRNRGVCCGKRNAVEVLSSDRASHSPILVQDEEQSQLNCVEDDADGDYPSPEPLTPVLASTRSGAKGRTGLACLATPASLAVPEPLLSLKTVLEPSKRMRRRDIERGRKRAPNGLLLTKNGKVDRRSLRLFSFFENEENLPLNTSGLVPESLQGRNQQSSDPFELPVLPSIERIESDLGGSFDTSI